MAEDSENNNEVFDKEKSREEAIKKLKLEDDMPVVSVSNDKSIMQQIGILIVGVVLGALVSIFFILSDIQIFYVSQDELIALEKQRVSQQPDQQNVELFNGQVEKAIGLIEEIAQSYEGSRSKVVFSRGPVNGRNVRSISSDVHVRLLEELNTQQEDKVK